MFPSSFETMRLIGRRARPYALGFAVLLGSSACSSDGDRRDQNYGTDAGAGYRLPDGGRDTAVDVSPEASSDAGAGADSASADTEVLADASDGTDS